MQQVPLEYAPSAIVTPKRPTPLRGEVTFASEHEQEQRCIELMGDNALVVRLPPPSSHGRGHLGALLEELVERELARAGAPSPYLAAWTAMPDEANARLADQLLRAQAVGASGVAIAMGTLEAIAMPSLCPDDSALLRWLAESTTALPLVLLIDDADLTVTAYDAPKRLDALFASLRTPEEPAVILTHEDVTAIENVAVSIDVAEAIAATAPDSDPATVPEPERITIVDPEPVTVHVTPASLEARVEAAMAAAEPFALSPSVCVEPIAPRPQRPSVRVPAIVLETMQRVDEVPITEAEVASVPEVMAAPIEVVATPVEDAPPAPAPRGRRMRTTARSAVVGVPEATAANDAWRSWALALSAARGAQPLAAFERLFVESYVPLANAIATGLEDPRALRAFDEFRRSFERSYTDAFTAFGATNRRPRLVMDAFDLASKQARLANARSAHILLIDSLRYDLGTMVRDALAREAHGVATLSSETMLWSALPTTTMRQLETLARGMDALRAPAAEEASESLRGRAAEAVRRLRVGSREIYKLDLVPALVASAGANVVHELPSIAQSVAEAIARHVTTLAPRTLLFILGDHGFTLDRRGEVQTGGASPEEVLVPSQSWLVGDLH